MSDCAAPSGEARVDEWIANYAPLIGRQIKALIWMPMTSDTPDLIAAYKSPSFSFTTRTQTFEPSIRTGSWSR